MRSCFIDFILTAAASVCSPPPIKTKVEEFKIFLKIFIYYIIIVEKLKLNIYLILG